MSAFFSEAELARIGAGEITEADIQRMEASPMVKCKKCSTPDVTVKRWLIFHAKCPKCAA